MKEYNKKNREDKREYMKVYMKEYNKKNRENKREYMKVYNKNKKENKKIENKEKYKCECCNYSTHSKNNLNIHFKSIKHNKNIIK